MCLCEWALVSASGHVSMQVGMCPCGWACVHSGEMRGTHARCVGRRCDDEGVGIHVSVRVGIHVSVRVGIHVSVQVGIHVAMQVGIHVSVRVGIHVSM